MSEPRPEIAKQGWSKDLADCVQDIITGYTSVSAMFLAAHPDLWMRPDFSWRSPWFQHTLFEKGRVLENGIWVVADHSQIVTHDDGTLKKSHHNVYPSQALDFIIFRGKTPLWGTSSPDNAALYAEIGQMFNGAGLVSGATWKYTWKDWGHIQASYNLL